MNDELNKMQRLLEEVTAAGNAPSETPDPEIASLREAWLAFGQLLEAAQGQEERDWPMPRPAQTWRWLLPTTGLLAASLLVAVAMAWMLRDGGRQDAAAPAPLQTASNTARSHSGSVEWDDSFDEQVAQLGQQVIAVRENQHFRVDDFALMEYRIEQFRQEVQMDSL
jgi:hypothetical protein